MNNYLLSVDPSMNNTGFTLWEKEKWIDENPCHNECRDNTKWKPIWIDSFNFKKDYRTNDCLFENNIKNIIGNILWEKSCELENKELNYVWEDYCLQTDLVIERGIFNPKMGRGKETLDHLRGFIAGQFNKLLTKDMLISSSEWRKYYKEIIHPKITTWTKEISFELANELIEKNNWDIEINDHDQAESLLIGWYYLNKEVNNET